MYLQQLLRMTSRWERFSPPPKKNTHMGDFLWLEPDWMETSRERGLRDMVPFSNLSLNYRKNNRIEWSIFIFLRYELRLVVQEKKGTFSFFFFHSGIVEVWLCKENCEWRGRPIWLEIYRAISSVTSISHNIYPQQNPTFFYLKTMIQSFSIALFLDNKTGSFQLVSVYFLITLSM